MPAKTQITAANTSSSLERLAPLLVLLATFLAYTRSLGNGFVFDDRDMILANPEIGKWSFLWKPFTADVWYFRPFARAPKSAYYRPLEDLWLGLNYRLFGFDPTGWHATLLLIHLIVVWLVYRLALRSTKDVLPSAVAALLFGLAPMHAQAVTWPTAVPLPMAAAFELLAMLAITNREWAAPKRLALSLFAFALALLSHESAIMFPALVAAYVFVLEPGDSRSTASRLRRALIESAPFLLFVIIYIVVRVAVLGFVSRPAPGNLASWGQVALSIPLALLDYLAIVIVPWLANPAHPFAFVSSITSARFVWPTLALLALSGLGYALFREHPHRRLYLFLLAWFLIGLAPVLNLRALVTDQIIQDRYLYLPSIAAFIFATDLVSGLALRRAAMVAAGAVGVLFAAILWQVEYYWHDEVTLFARCIELYPDSPSCHARLGMALIAEGDSAGAEREFQRTLALNPDDHLTLFNLGSLHALSGHPDQAEDEMTRAIAGFEIVPANAYLEQAKVSEAAHDRAGADRALAEAHRVAPGDPAVAVERAQIAAQRGDLPGAERILGELTAEHPDFANGWADLGWVLNSDGRAGDGLLKIERALSIAPDEPKFLVLRAQILHNLGRDRDALADCRNVLRTHPENQQARDLESEISQKTSGN